MKRENVAEKYKWRKEDIFPSIPDWENALKEFNKNCVEIIKFKGKLNDKGSFKACMKLEEELGKQTELIYCYASLMRDENVSSNLGNDLVMRAEGVLNNYSAMMSFITPELSSLDDNIINDYIADGALKEYKYQLEEILRVKKHILSANEERLLAMSGTAFHGFSNIFSKINNAELPLPYMTIDGVKQKLTHGKYSQCLQNPDPKIRATAFKGMYKAVGSLIQTIGANYAASVAKDNFFARARAYDSALNMSMDFDNVPSEVYLRLIEAVGKNLTPVHNYIALRKKVLGVNSLHMYDLYTAIVPESDLSCDYETAFGLVLDGLKPMGEEYINLLHRAKDNRWIDVEETENKRSGAYSMGVASVHPFVLLNYSKTTHDIFTIAHELGHAMHSYYSSETQTYLNADYSIFVAEVASTVNEVLLLKHLLKTEKDVNKKKFLLSYYLDMFRTTLFRQTMFAEFELKTHDLEFGGASLTVETMNKTYLALNKKYYGRHVVHDKQIKTEWARIPHFYSAFYVYKYATGLTSAVTIASAILSEGEAAVSRYKKFLCAGGSKSPYEILCDAGVDLTTETPYNVAMTEFASTLKELENLF